MNKHSAHSSFTSRELEILTLLAGGLSNEKTAAALFISINTVKTHISRIYTKLDANNRTEAVAKALSTHIISFL